MHFCHGKNAYLFIILKLFVILYGIYIENICYILQLQNIQFLIIYPYLIIKWNYLYRKTNRLFEPEV